MTKINLPKLGPLFLTHFETTEVDKLVKGPSFCKNYV